MNAKKFSYEMTIKHTHLDTFGHVNNAKYLELLEEARWDLMLAGGYGIEKIKATGQGPTIVEITIRYLKELCMLDKIVIETNVQVYKGKIGVMQQSVFRDSELCATAEIKFGLFDLKERKLILPTQDWLDTIGVHKA